MRRYEKSALKSDEEMSDRVFLWKGGLPFIINLSMSGSDGFDILARYSLRGDSNYNMPLKNASAASWEYCSSNVLGLHG